MNAKEQSVAPHITASRRIRKRIAPVLKGEEHLIISIVSFGVVTSLLSLAGPIAVQSLVNSVAFGSLTQQLIILTLVVFIVLCLSGVLSSLQLITSEQLQRRLFARFTMDLANRIPCFSARGMRGISGAELLNPYLEVAILQKSLAHILVGGLGVILQIIFGLLLLALYHPLLLLFAFILALAISGIVFLIGRSGVPTADAECSAKYDTLTWLEDVADMSIVFRSREGFLFNLQRATEKVDAWFIARARHFRILLYQHISAHITHAIGSAALLGLGGYLVIKGQLTLGQLVAAELVVSTALTGVIKFSKDLESLYDLSAALGKLNTLRSLAIENTKGDLPEWNSEHAASLQIADLTVGQYTNAAPLFDGLQLNVAAGEKIAVLGETGSGKTILAEVIYRLIEPISGDIIVDGHNIKDIDATYLRSRIRLVTEPSFFHGTLEENIRLHCRNTSRRELRTLLKKLKLEDKIQLLQDGLQTYITPNCRLFSYGEMLQIAVVRALLSNPGILILDQILDGVDGPSKDKIIHLLMDSDTDCTIIALTHDPLIAQTFDKTYTLAKGSLALNIPPTQGL